MAVAYQDIGAETGPLQHIWIGADGSANVRHLSDADYQFFPEDAVLGDFGTFLAVGGVLYAPDFADANHGTTGTSGLGTYTSWYNRSQTNVTTTENGISKVMTVLETANAALRLIQTDTYVGGQNCWRTDIMLVNQSNGSLSPVLYRAGDAFLHGSNNGYGAAKTNRGAVAVAAAANDSPPGNAVWLWPLVIGNHYENTAANLWTAIAAKAALADTIKTDLSHDAGMGLSWSLTIPARSMVVRSHLTQVAIAAAVTPPGATPWRFRGYTYWGPDGDTSTPLSGVNLRLWVETPGAHRILRTTVSDGSGFWNFYEDRELTTYEVEALVPTGMASTGVSTGDGTIISTTLLRWTSPARGVHDGNRFFFQ